MNTVVHPIAPEEVMAWLDGELSEADARAVLCTHLEQCVECARVADEFRATSRSLSPAGPCRLLIRGLRNKC